jgi:hypothetical protein
MNRISIKAVHDAPVLPDTGSPKRASLLPKILDRLEDPNVAVVEIIRLIAIEIAGIAEGMQRNEEIGTPRSQTKSPVERVKVLRLLSRSLSSLMSPTHATSWIWMGRNSDLFSIRFANVSMRL